MRYSKVGMKIVFSYNAFPLAHLRYIFPKLPILRFEGCLAHVSNWWWWWASWELTWQVTCPELALSCLLSSNLFQNCIAVKLAVLKQDTHLLERFSQVDLWSTCLPICLQKSQNTRVSGETEAVEYSPLSSYWWQREGKKLSQDGSGWNTLRAAVVSGPFLTIWNKALPPAWEEMGHRECRFEDGTWYLYSKIFLKQLWGV